MSEYPREFLYEVLVRGNEDGALVGAHLVMATQYAPGVVQIGDPRPVDPATVGAILEANFASLAAQLAQAQADAKKIADDLKAVSGERDELAAQLQSANEQIAALTPTPSEAIDWLSFMALFTLKEQMAVAASADPTVCLFRMMATGLGGDLHLSDPRVAQGLDALIAGGCIAPERKAEILNRVPPQN